MRSNYEFSLEIYTEVEFLKGNMKWQHWLQCPARVGIGSSRSEKWNKNVAHQFREWKVKWKCLDIEIESEKWNENVSRSRPRVKSEMKMPRDRDQEVKCQKNSREFSRNETLAGYWQWPMLSSRFSNAPGPLKLATREGSNSLIGFTWRHCACHLWPLALLQIFSSGTNILFCSTPTKKLLAPTPVSGSVNQTVS